MHRFFTTLALAIAVASASDTKKPAQSAIEKPALEAYVRHLFVWVPHIKVEIDDPKPAPMPGFVTAFFTQRLRV
ncbi:MAG: hypothetical protein M3461_10710 [Pseudomonadota bacterium]|nr:hypothetical protein [Pseudomonadota bacterium]